MKRLAHIVLLLTGAVAYQGCVTPIDSESIAFDDLLVVEGLFTNQSTKHWVKLSRTVQINSTEVRPVRGATITIESEDQVVLRFEEDKPGYYLSVNPFFARFDTKYKLRIITEEGAEYESSEVEMVPTPPIDRVYAEFIPEFENPPDPVLKSEGRFNFYLDVTNNSTPTRSFRYLWTETYKIKVPNPSRWKWLGGNDFEFRREDIPEMQEEFCFRHDSSSQIILSDSYASDGEILAFPIHSFEANREMNIRYSFEVSQYGLSADAERYWKGLAISSQSQGSLFDLQPGTIVGNIRSVNNPDEIVLGIFEVVQEERYRVFYYASDFFNQGFATFTNNWIDCNQELVTVPELEAGPYMIENNDDQELLFYISGGGGAVFGLRRCALCTLYGTNVQPSYWID